MAKQDTFKVSSRTHQGFEVVNSRRPENAEEFLSLNLVSSESDIVELAYQNWVIKAQARARAKLADGQEAVQKAVDEYIFGARAAGGTTTRRKAVKVDAAQAKDLRFTKAQIEALKAAGVVFDEAEATAEG